MRILQICTDFEPSDIQRHVLDLGRYFEIRGHTVVLSGGAATRGPSKDDASILDLEMRKITESGGSLFRRTANLLPVAKKLRRALKKHRVELIHAHETAPLIVAKLASIGMDIPVIYTFHGTVPARFAGVARTARSCADLTISPSQTSLDALTARGLRQERTRHIGLSVRPLPPIPSGDVARLRAELLGSEGRFLISSLSRMSPQNGIDMMIEVARKISDQRRDVIFAIGGQGPLSDMVQNWADITGVSGNVRILGAVEDVAPVLAASDLFLLTSRWEAFPLSIAEAFQCALPVVATDCGGIKELVGPEVGVVLPVGDTIAIADAVLELIENPDLRRQKSNNARDLSQQARFSPDAVHRQLEDIYQDLLTARK